MMTNLFEHIFVSAKPPDWRSRFKILWAIIRGAHGVGPEGFVHNCWINPREDDAGPLFINCGNMVIARLNGYAIIPLADLEQVAAKAGIELKGISRDRPTVH